jgi:hypothetical protein
MAIRLFFEYNGTVIQMPVNPPTLELGGPGNNETIEIVALGDISILKQKKLKTISIESFFPAKINQYAPYVLTQNQFQEPQFYMDFFEKIRDEKKPVRFIVTDTKINFLVSIESFTPVLNAGDDDTSYKLELLQYREHTPKIVTIQSIDPSGTGTPTATTSSSRPATGLAIGDEVTVNGNYWYTSYGDEPHGTFSNFRGKINLIVANTSRKYRYHITTLTGGFRGWVSGDQIKY